MDHDIIVKTYDIIDHIMYMISYMKLTMIWNMIS